MTGADAGSDACPSFVSLRPFVSSLNSRSARPVLLPKPASRVPPKISKSTARMISSSHTPSPKTSGVMSTSFSADDRQLVDILLRKTCDVIPANWLFAVKVIGEPRELRYLDLADEVGQLTTPVDQHAHFTHDVCGLVDQPYRVADHHHEAGQRNTREDEDPDHSSYL